MIASTIRITAVAVSLVVLTGPSTATTQEDTALWSWWPSKPQASQRQTQTINGTKQSAATTPWWWVPSTPWWWQPKETNNQESSTQQQASPSSFPPTTATSQDRKESTPPFWISTESTPQPQGQRPTPSESPEQEQSTPQQPISSESPQPEQSTPQRPIPSESPEPEQSTPQWPIPSESPEPEQSTPQQPIPSESPEPEQSTPQQPIPSESPEPEQSTPQRPIPSESPEPEQSTPQQPIPSESPEPEQSTPQWPIPSESPEPEQSTPQWPIPSESPEPEQSTPAPEQSTPQWPIPSESPEEEQSTPPSFGSSHIPGEPVNVTEAPHGDADVAERKCACDPEKLYLDVVVVVDSSLSMTKAGLMEVAADLSTIFQRVNVSTGTHPGQYVRVGLVTFSGYARVIGDFNSFSDYYSLAEALFKMPYHGDGELNIEGALQSASDILQNSRSYARTAILLYTSAYRDGGFTDAHAIANQIKESGTKIITVAFRQQPEGSLVHRLSHLASSNSSFASMDANIIDIVLHAFCQANCYCMNNWMQYANDLYKPTVFYGECIRAMDIDASWVTASFACKAMAPRAHLVAELTYHKHKFVTDYARAVLPSLQYSIGLRFDPSRGNYAWQTWNSTKIPYDAETSNNWNPGYPNRELGDCVSVVANGNSNSVGYQNEDCLHKPMRYVCQMPACDTTNLCTSFDN
ncbi:unnamed protein product [Toxocara canis]|uniref:VWFA domain-containing protein n=1 Tax=Toxocara canis TaxID=6265 RepID=A0A183UCT1_TOXCA|nr:unnamed protein product [Toxocara canis]